MNVDKNFCMSSYLAFRFIEDENKDFYEGIHHQNIRPVLEEEKIRVHSAMDIDVAIREKLEKLGNKKLGLLLSGGMDSASLASYMRGADAYTFRFLGGTFQTEELKRAEKYADRYNLNLHYVDIDWNTVESYVYDVMRAKAAPVHSIEPQILQAAIQAKSDGVEMMVVGASADLIFGGMDQLIGKDWLFDEFVERYIFTNPDEILVEPINMQYLFERYRLDGDKIDYLKFLKDVSLIECSTSYMNAFSATNMPYIDPYYSLVMAEDLDLQRIRDGESKYLIRNLFAMKYPDFAIPDKVPMPRPVDTYFEDWEGPTRPEFRKDIDMTKYTGNQKWQMWCLERFLEIYDK